jgi:ParB family chromosome partitioning protein
LIPTGTLAETEEVVQEIPVEHLTPSSYQPRKQVNEESLAELVESIKVHGIIQPLVARKIGATLELIAGERRLRAAKLAGLTQVPVLVREARDQEMLELALVENLQREDMNAMEQAEAYRRLSDEFGLTQEQVASRVGKSRSAVANSLRLLALPMIVRESLRKGEIEIGHGKILAGLTDAQQCLRLWRRIVRRRLSVREAEGALAKILGKNVPRGTIGAKKTPVALDPNLFELKKELVDRLGTKILLMPNPQKGGHIAIEYADEEDLDRITSIILGREEVFGN